MMDLKILGFLVACSLLGAIRCEDSCVKTEGKGLLEGCSVIKGLFIVSQGGTVVNDSNCDVLLPKQIFAKEPNVTYIKAQPDKFYTVLTIDPDAPNHTAGNFFLHMIKSNVKGSSLLQGDISSGSDVKNYVGPSPPKGSGDHRYLFIVYQQKMGNIKLTAPDSRGQFNLSQWIKDLPLCGPKGGVQFRARNEL